MLEGKTCRSLDCRAKEVRIVDQVTDGSPRTRPTLAQSGEAGSAVPVKSAVRAIARSRKVGAYHLIAGHLPIMGVCVQGNLLY